METRKFINDAKEKIRKDLDALPDYFSARAGTMIPPPPLHCFSLQCNDDRFLLSR